jgi:hypothetical protein
MNYTLMWHEEIARMRQQREERIAIVVGCFGAAVIGILGMLWIGG